MKKRLVAFLVLALVMVLALASCDPIGDFINQLKQPDEEYVIYFIAGEGTRVPSQTVKEGELVKEPETPVKTGYEFHGWYKDEALTTPWNFASDTITQNTMIYAKWILHVHVGGTATCTSGPICESCGEEYGEALGHKGGAATCTEAAVCEVCGESYGDPLGHKGTGATCTEDAVCEVCGVTYEEATGHTEEVLAAVAPTCTEDGLTEGKKCSACGEVLVAQETVPATGHAWGEWITDTDPTQDTDGTKHRECGTCGETETGTIPSLGHTHSHTSEVTTPATCEADGVRTYTCSCGDSYTEVIPATGHTEGEAVVENEVKPNCTTAGSYDTVVYCTACDKELSRETTNVDALGHKDEDGDFKCDTCDAIVEPEVTVRDGNYTVSAYNANGALYFNGTVTSGRFNGVKEESGAAVVTVKTVDGGYILSVGTQYIVMEDKAAGCGFTADASAATVFVWNDTLNTYVVADPDNARAFGCQNTSTYANFSAYAVSNTTGYNWGVFTKVEGTETPDEPECEHEGGHATCLEKAVCDKCGESYGELGDHDYDAVVTDPDCVNGGYTTYTCSVCEDSYVGDETDALGHTSVVDEAVAPTCTETGLTEGSHCDVCGEVLVAQEEVPALGHAWGEWVEDVPATEEADGTKHRTCGTCGEVEDGVIPSLEHVHNYTTVVTQPTCTEGGYTTYTCKCGDIYTDDETDALGHTEGEAVVENEVDPTCTVAGSYESVVYCSVCNAELSRTTVPVDALGHTPVVDEAVDPTCTATGLTEGSHCDVCGEVLVAQETVEKLAHADENGDFKCDTCSTVILPEADSTLTVAEAMALAKALGADKYTTNKYYITGVIVDVYNTQYGNLYIKDDSTSDKYTVYGLYSYDGKIRYDAMTYKPVKGDEITVYGVVGSYGTSAQMKNGWLDEVVAHEHNWSHEATCDNPATCSICNGLNEVPHTPSENELTCSTPIVCTECEKVLETVDHVDENENGRCDVCKTSVESSGESKTLTFEFGANGAAAHKDGNKITTYTETVDNYELTLSGMTNIYRPAYDAKGNSCIKLGTSSNTGKFSFTVPSDVTSVVIYVAQYKANTTKIKVNGTSYTITTASNNGAYTAITVDTSSTKTVSFETVSGGVRAMINSIAFVVPGEAVTHTHNPGEAVKENEVPATCTTPGSYDEVVYCTDSDCGEVVSRTPVEVDALGHDEVSHEAQAATCTEIGWNAYVTCTRCNHTTYEEISALGHRLENWIQLDPTCTEAGYTAHQRCSREGCGYASLYFELAPKGHTVVVDEAVEVTCTTDGKTEGSHCSVCNEVLVAQETITALGHDLENHDAKAPTYSEAGWEAYESCKREGCGYSTKVELAYVVYLEPSAEWVQNGARFAIYFFGGNGTPWVDMSDEDGDGVYEAEIIYGHTNLIFVCMSSNTANNWDNKVAQTADLALSDAGNCYRVVGNAGRWYNYPCAHEYSEVTCTEDAVCGICGHIGTVAPGHTWAEEVWTVVTAPTTEADGVKSRECSVCGTVTDAILRQAEVKPMLYLTPNSNWKQSNARFAAYFFEGNNNTWVGMSYNSELGVYEVEAPAGYSNVIFCRMNPGTTANNWDNKWNQTADLKVPADGTNHYTVKASTWDNGGGAWSTVTVTVEHEHVYYPATCTTVQTCYQCDATYGELADHNYGEWIVVVPSTCKVTGTLGHYACSVCEKNFDANKNELESLVIDIDPDAHFDGEDENNNCDYCNASLCTEHTWNEGEVVTEATCETAGSKKFTCTACGTTETRTVNALGHDYSADWTVDVPATCTEAGSQSHHCSRCDSKSDVTEIPATGHRYGNLVVNSASCTVDGYIEITCGNCNVTFDSREDDEAKQYLIDFPFINVTAQGHKTVVDEAVAPDCENTGLTEGSHCSVCNEVFVAQEVVPALGHNDGEIVVENVISPDCVNNGSHEDVVYCTVCDVELSRTHVTDEALGHELVDVTGKDATCTEEGYTAYKACENCDYTEGKEVIPAGHKLVDVEAKAATCTEDGYTAYKACENCDYTEGKEVVSATGHKDENGDFKCDGGCGEILAPEADTTLTLAQATALGQAHAHNTYTTGKYYITCEITEVYQTTYGNLYVKDSETAKFTVYGLYSKDGSIRYDAMEYKPVAGQTVTIYGKIGQYNDTAQMKDGWLIEIVHEHTAPENVSCLDATVCTICGHVMAEAIGSHSYNETGTCTVCGFVNHTHIDSDNNYQCDFENCGMVMTPEADSVLTVTQALTLMHLLGAETEHAYYVEGKIISIINTTYGNMYIADEINSLYIYGSYSADGSTRYDSMENPHKLCDNVKVYGKISLYNGSSQIKDGWVTVVSEDNHTAPSEVVSCLEDTKCTLCGEVMSAAIGSHNYVDGVCSVCGAEKGATITTTTYTFTNYTAGTQYADNEEHVLDENTTVITTDCHFTTQLRIYSSSTYNGYAIIKSNGTITGLSFNAGNKVDTLNVYVSTDEGSTWTLVEGVSITSTSYNDYTVSSTLGYSWIKLDVSGSNQVRVASITLTVKFDDSVCLHEYNDVVTKEATCTEEGVKTSTCTKCGEVTTTAIEKIDHSWNDGEVTTEATCTTDGETTYTCSGCKTTKTEAIEATDHTYVDGVCSVCGQSESTAPVEATDTMTIYANKGTTGTETISWTSTSGNVTFTNNKASSSTAIRTSDSDHYRVYANSQVVISGNDGAKITTVVITCTSGTYATAMMNGLTSAGYTATVNGSTVTVTVDSLDNITFTVSAQTRLNKIAVTYLK